MINFSLKSTAKSTRVRSRMLLGVLAAGTATVATVAFAAPTVPSPTISARPASPTAATHASFSFSGAPSGGSYQCSLDGSAFAACTSPKSYSGLAAGSHTFRVLAVDKSKRLSDPVAYTWTVDTIPPVASSIRRAAGNPTNASSVQWTIIFSEAVTGVDPTDFALVKSGITGGSSAVTLTGSGASYTATVSSTGSGDGTVGLNLVDDDSIKDLVSHALAGAGNGSKTGEAYTVDRTPPTTEPTISGGPTGFVNSSSATFSFSAAGISSFRCQIDAGPINECGSPAKFTGLADGPHTFRVHSADAAGNVAQTAASRDWTIDTVAPPAPTLTDKPEDPNGDGIAAFEWGESDTAVAYTCQLEGRAFTSCTSPYRSIVAVDNDGQHQFAVRAHDAAGNYSETNYRWKVLKGVNVTVDGDVVGSLIPGASRPIAVTFHNPNNFPVRMTWLEVSIASSPAGCGADANFELQQSGLTSSNTLTVPPNGRIALPAPGHPAPRITMKDTEFNQDACQNGTIGLKYVSRGIK